MIQTLVWLIIAGAVGGLWRHIQSHQGQIILPKISYNEVTRRSELDMGFLANVSLGAFFGLLVPSGAFDFIRLLVPEVPVVANNIVMAFLGGFFSAHALEKLAEFITVGKIGHQLALRLPTDTKRIVEDLEQTIQKQRDRRFPMPVVYPVEEQGTPSIGYSPEQHLEEIRRGTALGKEIIGQWSRSKKFQASAEFRAALQVGLSYLASPSHSYPAQLKSLALPKQIVIIVGGGWGDVVTNHSAFFRERDVVAYLKTLGWSEDATADLRLAVLRGSQATRAAFTGLLGIGQYTVWVNGTGHGNDVTLFCGWQNDPLMDLGNPQLARGLVMTIISCSGGKSVARRMEFDEIAEKSHVDTVWVCVDNQNNPAQDPSSAQFHRCFLAQDRAYAENKTFRDAATVEIATYHTEMNAQGTTPVCKFYLDLNLGSRQDVVKRNENWMQQLLGGAGPQPSKIDRVDFLVNEQKVGTATTPKQGNVFEYIHTVPKGTYKFRAIAYSGSLPSQSSNEVEIVVEEAVGQIICTLIAPKAGDTPKAGPIPIQVEAMVPET